jgi:hypothetical protein
MGRAAAPVGAAQELSVCRRFASDFFFRPFFLIVKLRLDPGIHAAVPLARRPHQRSCKLLVSMDHRIKSGGDEPEGVVTVAWHNSDAKSHRENEIACDT